MVQSKLLYLVCLLCLSYSCEFSDISKNRRTDLAKSSHDFEIEKNGQTLIHEDGTTVDTRFKTPKGFRRIEAAENSFASFLRKLPLKAHGAKVLTYNGSVKPNYDIYEAVIDLPIGSKNLHQCADAIMRLWADYLWQNERFTDIHFHFTNGWRADYSEWKNGKRIVVDGNDSYWVTKKPPSNTYEDYWQFMELIFTYAGTLSLDKELVSTNLSEMQIGDIFIRGGSPGHAVIVVDMCENENTGEKLFMLAQSYMPAQDIQVLQNPSNESMSPWYSSKIGDILITPEWSFYPTERKRFPNAK